MAKCQRHDGFASYDEDEDDDGVLVQNAREHEVRRLESSALLVRVPPNPIAPTTCVAWRWNEIPAYRSPPNLS